MTTHYPLTWITRNIATGRAPLSYEDLDYLKEQGIAAIVNLCGEYSDLHELEEQAGFEVFWLPIPDETAPPLAEMETGLAWLDEAVYLGKKVLIHCRHGIGRTGTFMTAYLLRRGFGLKRAGKLLKKTPANPSNFSQWSLLRKFGKKEGRLKLGEPTPENRNGKDFGVFYDRYERLLEKVDKLAAQPLEATPSACCKLDKKMSCGDFLSLELIEALYLNNKVNIALTAGQRQSVINKAVTQKDIAEPVFAAAEAPRTTAVCPLLKDRICMLHQYRPLRCRLQEIPGNTNSKRALLSDLEQLSQDVLTELFGQKIAAPPPQVSFQDSVSGKFIQSYFHFLVSQNRKP